MTRILLVIAFASFAAALFARMTDPMVPQIAADLAVDPHSVALLGTAFALPWALVQLVLGPVGDLVGKTRVITVCLVILVVSAVIGAFATSFPVLLASRILAGAAAGGVSPVAMAFVSDLVAVESRQVAIGRVLTASITGILLGGTVSGVLADFIGWRSIFVVTAACAALATLAAAHGLACRRAEARRPRQHRRCDRELPPAACESTHQDLLQRCLYRRHHAVRHLPLRRAAVARSGARIVPRSPVS